MTDDEIDKLCINESTITEKINNLYMEYSKNPVIYKKINAPGGKMMNIFTFLLRKEFLFLMYLIQSNYFKTLFQGKKQG